jgi:uroporphyrinogen decarboxylase
LSVELLLKACRRQPTERVPVWFMRQAGRYLPEYRKIRAQASLLEICHDPALATEVTLQPVERFNVDAAIIFADILLPFEPLGLDVTFEAGEGPVIGRPIRTAADVARLPEVDPVTDLGHVLEALRLVRRELGTNTGLIGFAGGPFTLASYAIEGGATRNFVATKRLMYGDPDAWHDLLDRLARLVGRYLADQVEAGADVVQLFDSWIGCLSPEDYRRFVLPHSARAIAAAREAGAPLIHFATGSATLLPLMRDAGGDVVGVDWRVPLDRAWESFPDRGIQGNLDPVALLAPLSELRAQVQAILNRAGGRPGHIFNLGHGVLPETPPEQVQAVVNIVRDWDPTLGVRQSGLGRPWPDAATTPLER